MNYPNRRTTRSVVILFFLYTVFATMAYVPIAALAENNESDGSVLSSENHPNIAEKINVLPVAEDKEIAQRLAKIMKATDWFIDISVEVEEGVVFLDGRTTRSDNRVWAGELAGKTMDVVAVVNRIEVIERSPWDISPAMQEVRSIWNGVLQSLPRYGLGIIVLILVWLIAKLFGHGLRRILQNRLNVLLRDVVARMGGILLFIIGFYLALQVAGLSGLSATVLGGTGIAGLVAGIAFRDLLENYLASILISLRNPFLIGDLVEIHQHVGVVERVTTRGTVLMNPDGNHVQIPNAIVYKSIIRNYTANPYRREMFNVGIGFESSVSDAQRIALDVLTQHPAVMNEPELLILVDSLGSATVNLKVYFWYDGAQYNGLKVKSSLIRLVKQSFEKAGISMPDEAREILFPEGVPVTMVGPTAVEQKGQLTKKAPPITAIHEEITTEAEGDLVNEEVQLREQARMARTPEEGKSLLDG